VAKAVFVMEECDADNGDRDTEGEDVEDEIPIDI
jgi:hypothetical protein